MQQPLLLNACKKAVHFLILLQLLCHSAMPHCSLGIHSAPTSPWKLIYKVVAREVTMGTGECLPLPRAYTLASLYVVKVCHTSISVRPHQDIEASCVSD